MILSMRCWCSWNKGWQCLSIESYHYQQLRQKWPHTAVNNASGKTYAWAHEQSLCSEHTTISSSNTTHYIWSMIECSSAEWRCHHASEDRSSPRPTQLAPSTRCSLHQSHHVPMMLGWLSTRLLFLESLIITYSYFIILGKDNITQKFRTLTTVNLKIFVVFSSENTLELYKINMYIT
jgi:hypothetical protein